MFRTSTPGLLLTLVASPVHVAVGDVTYENDVAPILEARCVHCHGPERREGGLRLDSFEHARRGGESQLPIVADSLDENELYRRVTSDDEAFRMPWNASPLPAEELEVLRTWIESGAGGPSKRDQASGDGSAKDEEPGGWLESLSDTAIGVADWLAINPYLIPLLVGLLAMQAAFLVVERLKKRETRLARASESDDVPRRFRRFGVVHYGLAMLAYAALFAITWYQGKVRLLEASIEDHETAKLQSDETIQKLRVQAGMVNGVKELYGDPPVPVRLGHPKALARTYYRGNNERNPKLYNNGNYRTCTMWVELCRADGTPISHGEAVPEDGLHVRFAFERSPGAVPTLFEDRVIEKIVLSETYPLPRDGGELRAEDDHHLVEAVEKGERWRAIVPLPAPARSPETGTSEVAEGLYYVYYGQSAHYAFGYRVVLEDGAVSEESDVWMGNLFVPAQVMALLPGKVPADEWFDYRPIPVIEGENSLDTELLGVDEHLRGELSGTTDERPVQPAGSTPPPPPALDE